MNYVEEKRDIFDYLESKEHYFVQCISADFAMGAGIAKAFNEHFDAKNRMFKKYDKNVWNGHGRCAELLPDVPVFNLITKRYFWHTPSYKTITEALEHLRELAEEHGIKKLVMPKIGCGLDRLDWDKVSKIIKYTFGNRDFDITICYI